MELFSICCTTCKTRLKVRDQSAIGQILKCPKCGSMVLITPPPEWADGKDARATQPAHSPPPASPPAAARAGRPTDGADSASPLEKSFEDVDQLLADAPPVMTHPPARQAAIPPPPPPSAPSAATPDRSAPAPPAEQPATGEPLLPDSQWHSPRLRRIQHLLLLGVSAVAGLMLAVLVVGWIATGRQPQAPETQTTQNTEATARQPQAGDDKPDGQKQAEETLPDNRPHEPKRTQPAAKPKEEKLEIERTDEQTMEALAAAPASSKKPSPGLSPPSPPETREGETAVMEADNPPGLEPREETDSGSDPHSLLDGLKKMEVLAPDGSGSEKTEPSAGAPDAAAEATLPARPPVPPVDVTTRLSDPIAAIELPETALADFVRFVSDLSTVPITLDPEGLARAGVSPSSPVTVKLADTTFGGLLRAGLAPLQLAAVTTDGHVRVTDRRTAEGKLRQVTYRVDDLAANQQELVALAQMVRELIEPHSWQSAGGPGQLKLGDRALLVRHVEPVQFQVLLLCEKLRVARRLKPRSAYPPSLFALQSPRQRARSRLTKPVSVTYLAPTRLVDILQQLEREADVHILVDWQALAAAGWSRDTTATLTVRRLPLDETLTRLLKPKGLAYRVVHEAVLQISTPKALARVHPLQFYSLTALLDRGIGQQQAIKHIHQQLSQQGLASPAPRLAFDEPSECLVAALTPAQHRAVAEVLDRILTAP